MIKTGNVPLNYFVVRWPDGAESVEAKYLVKAVLPVQFQMFMKWITCHELTNYFENEIKKNTPSSDDIMQKQAVIEELRSLRISHN